MRKLSLKRKATNLRIGDEVSFAILQDQNLIRIDTCIIGYRKCKYKDREVISKGSSLFLSLDSLKLYETTKTSCGLNIKLLEINLGKYRDYIISSKIRDLLLKPFIYLEGLLLKK